MGQAHLRPRGPRRVLESNGCSGRSAARRSAYGLSNTHFLRVLKFRERLELAAQMSFASQQKSVAALNSLGV
jgi:hypothetical protein